MMHELANFKFAHGVFSLLFSRYTHAVNKERVDLHTAQVPPMDKLSSNVHITLGLGVGHDLGTLNREAGHLARAHVYGDFFRVRTFVSYCATVYVYFEHEFNPLNPELNPIFYLLAFLAHHFLHVSRIRVK